MERKGEEAVSDQGPEIQLQSLDQTLSSKSEQMFSLLAKPKLQNLQQTVANMILIFNISNSNNLNKFWVGIFTCQGYINQVSTSDGRTDKARQWSDLSPIKIK